MRVLEEEEEEEEENREGRKKEGRKEGGKSPAASVLRPPPPPPLPFFFLSPFLPSPPGAAARRSQFILPLPRTDDVGRRGRGRKGRTTLSHTPPRIQSRQSLRPVVATSSAESRQARALSRTRTRRSTRWRSCSEKEEEEQKKRRRRNIFGGASSSPSTSGGQRQQPRSNGDDTDRGHCQVGWGHNDVETKKREIGGQSES